MDTQAVIFTFIVGILIWSLVFKSIENRQLRKRLEVFIKQRIDAINRGKGE